MAIRFETPDGKIRTAGGGDPKVKTPTGGILSKFSGIGRAEPPDVGHIKRLEARLEAMEHVVAAQSKQVTTLAATLKSMLESMLVESKTPPLTKTVNASVDVTVNKPTVNARSKATVNARGDMAAYMRDHRKAKKLGLTVTEYRSKNERSD